MGHKYGTERKLRVLAMIMEQCRGFQKNMEARSILLGAFNFIRLSSYPVVLQGSADASPANKGNLPFTQMGVNERHIYGQFGVLS